ncbi:type II restriction endonuclease [Bradyrhizobium canariense]|uniref:Type II restriction endonuclease n=1 Tax=Bradyrhizobium canariense TaxID=255045 RepID=A0A1X3GNI7_9BRAD|nr:type II restriction endonuclease [Bradyrhizobium canariense]OSI70861.1 type II restriction endonuclease [Bradyrhizobium canariense]OSI79702.1 type II restriction endonuclease [Bradyrhizobium canariense]OSI92319.1 type II restriction endonuclease [Bradyrhizobium canariense]OSI94041.1 type II restriction endonuclease [Bradyrhizobium canariense]OSJ01786.1 type II restriction endonuclease [Bradyrhizobium canariense]
MALVDVTDWMNEFGAPGHLWYAKRLSGNDTLANGSHQAGPYVSKDIFFQIFPTLNRPDVKNPDLNFDLYVDSHSDYRFVRAIWYNGKVYGDGTRNEARLTNFGGASSALLDPDSTGALAIFSFTHDDHDVVKDAHVWVCRNEIEEDLFEDRIGPVEPKQTILWKPGEGVAPDLKTVAKPTRKSCALLPEEMPPDWLIKFPSGETIIKKTLALRPPGGMAPDERLLRRRVCEYEMFQSIEAAFFMPRIQAGKFSSIEGFISLAQSILQSRKSRSGNSLELHAREIMMEEGLDPKADFCHRPVVEGGKRPDFIFPSQAAYDDDDFPPERLRMLAAKTTCKDRWRQIINEANRIKEKHLLTLQEGISVNQFAEMCDAGIKLVVPNGLHESYSEQVRPHLVSFESFIADIRMVALTKRV